MARSILLLHCHDLGRFLGAYGVTTVSTPHLDRLAAESTVFESAFATSPHCSPARASLFTGSYPQQHGVLGLTHEPFGWDLIDPTTHIAHRLSRLGYATELIGVHHESRTLPDDELASRLGFDLVRTGGDRDVVVERTIDALRRAASSDQPFYLQVGFHEPHRTPSRRDRDGIMGFLGDGFEADESRGVSVPAYLSDTAEAHEEMAELQGAVRHMDEGVGAILAELDQLGLAEDTLVVFTTDHGLALPRAKCTLYDAGVGVALFMRVPGAAAWHGRRIRSLVSHVDVVPTLLELAASADPAGAAGTSLVALVEHDAAPRAFTFGQLTYHTYFDPKRSVRSADAKLILNLSNAPRAMDPTQSWMHRSIPVDLTGPTIGTSPLMEFYDLGADPEELVNLIDEPARAPQIAELATALQEWMRETEDPLLSSPASPRHRLALTSLDRIARMHRAEPIDAPA
ncbi:sulfatase [Microbacterium sp. LTA6]|uniref:sulfatase family protein n=1 Tax=Microbacterium sp. LTA6 TaxID=3129771 RepID=UPI00325624D0